MTTTTRDTVNGLDSSDPLAHYRDRFLLPPGTLYFDGNSLGPLPKETVQRMQDVIASEWGAGLIASWLEADWINAPLRVGNKIAGLIGAGEGEVIVADSTSINLFKTLDAALKLNPGRTTILSEAGNFPTDLYMAEGLASLVRDRANLAVVDPDEVLTALDENVAVLMLTQVHYKTGFIHDMKAITEQAHAAGALVIWDLSHSAGSIPLDLNGCDVDFAVGCGYKFLNGGPGAPAFLFAAQKHLPQCRPVLSGWFGHKDQFAFADSYTPTGDIRQFLCGTTPILGISALETGVDIFCEVDMASVRNKAIELGKLFIRLLKESHFEQYGFKLVSPEDSRHRGGHISIAHENGYAIMQAIKDRGLVGDFRSPDVLRFGITPLYQRFADVYDAAGVIREVMETAAWDREEYKQRSLVT